MKNPIAALNALNDGPIEVGCYTFYPITLGLMAIFQQIESPIYTGIKPDCELDWAATLYAFTRKPAVSRKIINEEGVDTYVDLAIAWADDELTAHDATQLLIVMQKAMHKLSSIEPDRGDTEEGDLDHQNPTGPGLTDG